jgi:predicted AAA+ superfamily ATPase
MVCGLPKYAADAARKRGSSPKLQVFNTALMSAGGTRTFEQARSDKEYWGHLVESSVGAHLINAQLQGICTVYYWRAGDDEVDFVVESRGAITAIEVKSGRAPRKHAGLTAFHRAFNPDRILLVGGDGISVNDFLRTPVEDMVGGER